MVSKEKQILKVKELNNFFIVFQGKRLNLGVINYKDGQMEEVLPGVYIAFYNSKLWLKLEQMKDYFNLLIMKTIIEKLSMNCNLKVQIEINNRRDHIRIENELKSCSQEDNIIKTVRRGETPKEGNDPFFQTDKLPYPDSLGSGGCCMENIFSSLGLTSKSDDLTEDRYEFFSLDEILEMTSSSKRAKELCEMDNSECRSAMEKLRNGTYKALYDGGNGNDDITIYYDEETGTYEAGEGKHRVCAAKRFGIKTIPVVLKINHAIKDWKKTKFEEENISRELSIYNYKKIVEDFYSTCEKIGLNHDQALGILNSDDIIKYIEDETGEDITIITKRINDENPINKRIKMKN